MNSRAAGGAGNKGYWNAWLPPCVLGGDGRSGFSWSSLFIAHRRQKRLTLRRIYPPVVPVERIPAQHLLGAVEQRPDIAAGRLVGEFLHPVLHRNGRVLHDVEPGIDLEDLIGARIARIEELYFGGRVAARRTTLVFHMCLQALAVGADEFPVLLALRHAVGGVE